MTPPMVCKNYSIEQYLSDIDSLGIDETWKRILERVDGPNLSTVSELYEIGLAHANKTGKKIAGKYNTPPDVARLMAEFLLPFSDKKICDVCCGTGNLIMAYLELLPDYIVQNKIVSGDIYIYDNDSTAIDICLRRISERYDRSAWENVNIYRCDFLSESIQLPLNAAVISNPPYHRLKSIPNDWNITDNIVENKETYSAFMEKILETSDCSVILTSFSFMGGGKFSKLRQLMGKYGGDIYAFDNIPGGIFHGKKHGVFNTNTSNSVRAAITVTRPDTTGYRTTPLIRFKSNERGYLLKQDALERFLGSPQIITTEHPVFVKCDPFMENLYNKWNGLADDTFDSLIADGCHEEMMRLQSISDVTPWSLYFSTTCRYYTVAAVRRLNRTGRIYFGFRTQEDFLYAYAILNSSFAYWWWRLYDGAITYPLSLLKRMPITKSRVGWRFYRLYKLVNHAIKMEEQCCVYKKNAGEFQETIQFPEDIRHKFNEVLIETLDLDYANYRVFFERLHSNSLLRSYK